MLTVEVSDGRGGTAEAEVDIEVTDVPEDLPPAPDDLGVSLEDETFSLSWTAVTGADRYEAQYRIAGSEDDWTALPATGGTSVAFSPVRRTGMRDDL